MLSQIIEWLRERRSATIAELALHFDMDATAMEGMLRTLEQKGRVEKICGGKCAGCKGCALVNPMEASIYRAV
jgi:DeoR/GlpR family transcriptional regulator of sugar metabolism